MFSSLFEYMANTTGIEPFWLQELDVWSLNNVLAFLFISHFKHLDCEWFPPKLNLIVSVFRSTSKNSYLSNFYFKY